MRKTCALSRCWTDVLFKRERQLKKEFTHNWTWFLGIKHQWYAIIYKVMAYLTRPDNTMKADCLSELEYISRNWGITKVRVYLAWFRINDETAGVFKSIWSVCLIVSVSDHEGWFGNSSSWKPQKATCTPCFLVSLIKITEEDKQQINKRQA